MHVDTGHNFPEVLEFRDRRIAELGARLIVGSVQDAIDTGEIVEERGPRASRNRLQTPVLLAPSPSTSSMPPWAAHGATKRRRAPRNASSHSATSSASGTRATSGPSSGACTTACTSVASTCASSRSRNWTELDVWRYIEREELDVPSIYFTHEREVFERDGMLMAVQSLHRYVAARSSRSGTAVRYRTVGDMTCTAALRSHAADIDSRHR